MRSRAVAFQMSLLVAVLSLLAVSARSQITPSGDSYINTATPTKNYGSQTLLDVDGASQITYIQFNLASVPTTATISQATLKLYVNSVTTAGSFNVDYVNGSWSESTIDASNAPPPGSTIASNVAITAADKNQYILINVTSAVQAWLNGSETNNGIALVANSSFNATFDSKENTTTSHPAELDIAYAGGNGTITGIETASGSGLTGGGTNGTLNLSLTNGCATNQVLEWNGSAWVCANAGVGTITGVAAGTDLTGGGTSGTVTLNLDTSQVPLLVAANTFTGNQTVNGNVAATGSISAAAGNFSGLVTANGALLPPIATATTSQGYNSQPIDVVASVYNTSLGGPLNQDFRWQVEPLGNDTPFTTGTLNLLYAYGSNQPAETGLNINSLGQITFAKGQTFPGAGTITAVIAGSGLNGGGNSGNVTLSIPTGGVTNTMLLNPSLTINPGTGLVGGGPVALGGSTTLSVDPTQVPLLNANNVFTGNQTVHGNLSATGVVTGSAFQIGSNLFDYGSYANGTSFLGFAGNTTATGSINTGVGLQALGTLSTGRFNTAVGYQALESVGAGGFNTATGAYALAAGAGSVYNTADGEQALQNNQGYSNTAEGYGALWENSTGNQNTGNGVQSLFANTTGSNNTAIGFQAGNVSTGSNNTLLGAAANTTSQNAINNATAIGANAEVDISNAMVLGSINGVNGAGSSVNVGIGTTTPAYTLDVHGTANFTGLVTFAPGQPFAGAGTITGVTAGTGLSGGGTSGNVTLSNTGVLGVTAGTGITLSGTSQTPTVGINSAVVPLLNAANVFTANQTVNANLSVTGVVAGGSYEIGSNLFAFGSYANSNAFLGFAGNTSMTGVDNTATGYQALHVNGTGSENTANGFEALYSNSSGGGNTATGYWALQGNGSGSANTATGVQALYFNSAGSNNTAAGNAALELNSTGSHNTAVGNTAGWTIDSSAVTGSNDSFLGANTSLSTGTLTNATAIGANAEVAESNALVLGSINGVNGATASVNVGIGTTAPISTLDVEANVPGGLDPTVTLTNNGGNGQVSLDFNTTPVSNSGTYNPGARFEAVDDGNYSVNFYFQSNIPGAPNKGLQTNMVIQSKGPVGIGTPSPDALLSVNGSADKPGGGSWGTYSDGRLKTLHGNFDSGLSQIMKINPVRYRYKDDNGMGIRDHEEHVGLVAQEVQKVIPEAVTENSKGYLLVNNDPILWAMLNAIKEQQGMIEQQKEQSRVQQAQIKAQRAESKLQQAEIASLTRQVRAVQAALKASSRTNSGIRTVKAEVPVVHQ